MNKQILEIPKAKSQWQIELSEAITNPTELLATLRLDRNLLAPAQQASQLFKLIVPKTYLEKIEPNNLNDPLLKQVLPDEEELNTHAEFTQDPLNESKANVAPGLLHKYHGRVLLTVTGVCSINCRYCFRRHFPYQDNQLSQTNLNQVLKYLNSDPTIQEVIYSGGDPLIANDRHLARITEQITQIPHIKRLRIHTRLPVTIPSRITPEFIDWFTKLGRQNILVIHCNHPNEIDKKTAKALQPLREAHVTLLNQSVLLNGVNDNAKTLAHLSDKLFEMGVTPYYLHLLDKVAGATHFDMSLARAKLIYHELQTLLPGFLVPKLVKESPNIPYKEIIN